eukprot:950184-Rhodomonas_salina.1
MYIGLWNQASSRRSCTHSATAEPPGRAGAAKGSNADSVPSRRARGIHAGRCAASGCAEPSSAYCTSGM